MTRAFAVVGIVLLGFALATGPRASAAPRTNSPSPFAKGTITELDQRRQALTILTKKGKLASFGWTDRTYIFLGKQKLSADKLVVGDRVAIRHDNGPDGQRLVVRMKVYRDDQPGRLEPDPLPTP